MFPRAELTGRARRGRPRAARGFLSGGRTQAGLPASVIIALARSSATLPYHPIHLPQPHFLPLLTFTFTFVSTTLDYHCYCQSCRPLLLLDEPHRGLMSMPCEHHGPTEGKKRGFWH